MNRKMKIIREVSTQAVIFYNDAVRLEITRPSR